MKFFFSTKLIKLMKIEFCSFEMHMNRIHNGKKMLLITQKCVETIIKKRKIAFFCMAEKKWHLFSKSLFSLPNETVRS